ncbi:MAG TPA: sulfite exporter TauE/SafE family protein, partial [Nitriliruptoraceae bacterium]|nr:sulfite exporter TauE/SafE family protein [Nitriliruptoraceae bacterium]
LTMPVAVGTSLLVIAMKSAAGLAGYLASVDLDWPLALAVTAAAIGGSFLGTRLVDRTNPAMLRRGFGWFVVAAAILVLAQQVPAAWTTWLPGPVLAWAAVPIAVVAAIAFVDLRRRTGSPDTRDGDPAIPDGPASSTTQALS